MYKNLRASTIRLIQDVIAGLPNTGFPIQYMDWDAHADVFELPDADLVGLTGFGATQEGHFHDFVFGIGIVTYNDENIFRLSEIVDHFYTRCAVQQQFVVYDTNTGERIGIATIFDGTTVNPITRAEVRPAQSVQVTARFVPDGSDA